MMEKIPQQLLNQFDVQLIKTGFHLKIIISLGNGCDTILIFVINMDMIQKTLKAYPIL